jgi:hypothetical protein
MTREMTVAFIALGFLTRMQQAPKLGILLVLVGCAGPAQQTAPAPPPPPQYIEFGMTVEEPAPVPDSRNGTADPTRPAPAPAPQPAPPAAPAAADPLVKNQPPHIKLKLGHFRNDRYNIGLTIDLTEQTENVADIDPAKLRFDGDTRIWRLQGQHGAYGRIDYVREGGRVMLHAQANGRMSIYIPDPDTGRSSDEISLYRDGDADPL